METSITHRTYRIIADDPIEEPDYSHLIGMLMLDMPSRLHHEPVFEAGQHVGFDVLVVALGTEDEQRKALVTSFESILQ